VVAHGLGERSEVGRASGGSVDDGGEVAEVLRAEDAGADDRERLRVGVVRVVEAMDDPARDQESVAGWAGWYAEPMRLQATRSALGAIAAVGSICSRVSCSTTASSSVGRRASSSCARTAMRRACAFVIRCADRNRPS
jgi:hypothetical protein